VTALRLSVNAVLQPVGGDVGLNARIVGDLGKVEEKKQPQCQAGQCEAKKKPAVFADQVQHVENIS